MVVRPLSGINEETRWLMAADRRDCGDGHVLVQRQCQLDHRPSLRTSSLSPIAPNTCSLFTTRSVPFHLIDALFARQVVDGGENHVRVPQLPYPQAVLDPKSMMDRIQAKI